jgi:hypothetical protein
LNQKTNFKGLEIDCKVLEMGFEAGYGRFCGGSRPDPQLGLAAKGVLFFFVILICCVCSHFHFLDFS